MNKSQLNNNPYYSAQEDNNLSPTAGIKHIRLSEKGQRPALGLINNLGRA